MEHTENILKDMASIKCTLSLMAKRAGSITLDRAADKLNDAIELVNIYANIFDEFEDKDNDWVKT